MAESNATPIYLIVRSSPGNRVCEVCFKHPTEMYLQFGLKGVFLCPVCIDDLVVKIQENRKES